MTKMAHLMKLPSIFFLMLAFNVPLCDSATFLLLPDETKSHVIQHTHIGTELVKNGNNVYILLSDKFKIPSSVESEGIEIIRYHTEKPFIAESSEFQREFIKSQFETSPPVKLLLSVIDSFKDVCDTILGNSALMQRLESLNVDVALLYGFPAGLCFYLIPYKLSIPYATVFSAPFLVEARVPTLPSFVPSVGAPGQPLTEQMTFLERLRNTFAMFLLPLLTSYTSYKSQDLVEKHFPGEVQLNILYGKTKLWLMDKDFILDYPGPTVPHTVEVGGLTTSPPNSLPTTLQKLVSEAKHGVIVVSFGSLSTDLPPEVNTKLLNAFRQLKELVVWRCNGPSLDESPNVKILKWLPQNDLLGHNNTRLFITHCGINGQFEAVYHGVPMIGLPLQAEQDYNAARMQYKGFGLRMNLKKFTPEELVSNIKLVLNNRSYKASIGKASQIFRSRPMNPRQRAAYWLEHIAKYGSDHLHSYALEMPLYQFLMLDILLFLCVVMFIVILSVYFVLKTCMRYCSKAEPKIKFN